MKAWHFVGDKLREGRPKKQATPPLRTHGQQGVQQMNQCKTILLIASVLGCLFLGLTIEFTGNISLWLTIPWAVLSALAITFLCLYMEDLL